MRGFGIMSGISYHRENDYDYVMPSRDENFIVLHLKTPIPSGGISCDDICDIIKSFYNENKEMDKNND
jgi:hypothetical protein